MGQIAVPFISNTDTGSDAHIWRQHLKFRGEASFPPFLPRENSTSPRRGHQEPHFAAPSASRAEQGAAARHFRSHLHRQSERMMGRRK